MKKNTYQYLLICIPLFCLASFGAVAQVGINTTTPASGALLDVSSTNKGILIPRVELTGTNDNSTITPSATIGLLVYNTDIANAGSLQVTPGFYYWSGNTTRWRRFFNQGYALYFQQGNELNPSNTTDNVLPDLDTGNTNITVPFSGTYQIICTGYYSIGNQSGTVDGAGQASLSLYMRTNTGALTKIKESYVTSISKRIGGTSLQNLAQQVTIIQNVELDANSTYRFQTRGREWVTRNAAAGRFGRDTNGYPGALGVTNAQKGTMSITLIKQN